MKRGKGRPAEEYLLNKKQFLLLASLLSNTPRMREIKKCIVEISDKNLNLQEILEYINSKVKAEESKDFIYVIKTKENKVKIGRSKNPIKRIRSLETQGNLTITEKFISDNLVKANEFERILHQEFKTYREKGEWFSDCYKLAKERVENFANAIGKTPFEELGFVKRTNPIMVTNKGDL